MSARAFSKLNSGIMSFIVHVTRTLIIVAVALAIHQLAQTVIFSRRRLLILTGLAIDEALLPFIRTGVQLIVLALALVIIIQEWGYDVTGLIAGLGLGGLALSLAAQDTLANLFGFAAIISDRPFVVGEYVKTKDVEGLIERVGLRSTRVRQLDQAIVAVPNSMLAASSILNWSRLARRRIDLTLGVTYKTRPDQMETLLSHLRAMLGGPSNRRTEFGRRLFHRFWSVRPQYSGALLRQYCRLAGIHGGKRTYPAGNHADCR